MPISTATRRVFLTGLIATPLAAGAGYLFWRDSMSRPTTEEWARSHNISCAATPPAIDGYDEPCRLTARQIATRAIILQGVVAVAANVDPIPVVDWLRDQDVWNSVTPHEQVLLLTPASVPKNGLASFQWRMEAEWALLWVVGKVDSLGLPTHQCDSRRLVDEIIPELGSDIEPFLASTELRSPGVLLAEIGTCTGFLGSVSFLCFKVSRISTHDGRASICSHLPSGNPLLASAPASSR
jgi:hypothetical protein